MTWRPDGHAQQLVRLRGAGHLTLPGHSRGMHNIPLRAAQAMFRRANPQPPCIGHSHQVTKGLHVERNCVDPSGGLCRRDPCGTAGLHTAIAGLSLLGHPKVSRAGHATRPHSSPLLQAARFLTCRAAPPLGHEVIPGVAGKQGTLSNGEARRDRTGS